MDDEIAIENGK